MRRTLALALLGGLAAIPALTSSCAPGGAWEDASCPPGGTTHTYENFGRQFMDHWCQSCHSSLAEDRKGAPGIYQFDDVDDIRRYADRIYERSAAGNTSMPPGPDDPSADEREALADWLACGSPTDADLGLGGAGGAGGGAGGAGGAP